MILKLLGNRSVHVTRSGELTVPFRCERRENLVLQTYLHGVLIYEKFKTLAESFYIGWDPLRQDCNSVTRDGVKISETVRCDILEPVSFIAVAADFIAVLFTSGQAFVWCKARQIDLNRECMLKRVECLLYPKEGNCLYVSDNAYLYEVRMNSEGSVSMKIIADLPALPNSRMICTTKTSSNDVAPVFFLYQPGSSVFHEFGNEFHFKRRILTQKPEVGKFKAVRELEPFQIVDIKAGDAHVVIKARSSLEGPLENYELYSIGNNKDYAVGHTERGVSLIEFPDADFNVSDYFMGNTSTFVVSDTGECIIRGKIVNGFHETKNSEWSSMNDIKGEVIALDQSIAISAVVII